MNNAEARSVLEAELTRYRDKPYSELVSLIGNVEVFEITGASGASYQLEIEAMWDDPKKPNDILRIIGSVDDGGLRAYKPLSDSFLIAPNGEFVGE